MDRLIRRLATPFIALLLCAAGGAQAQFTPETLPGVKVVKADDVVAALKAGAVVIDTRVANEYAEEHIKGARSVPYKEKSAKSVNFDAAQDSFDLSKLPADKNALIVFYCNAGECWKSYKSSVAALRAGYKNIAWFRGGMPEWKSQKLPVE